MDSALTSDFSEGGEAGVRTFASGATRDTDAEKLDYEGFLSPRVLERYAIYMHQHRKQFDGRLRDSDNWQKGMPRSAYLKSLIRHTFDAWRWMRHWQENPEQECEETRAEIENLLCAIMFNSMGLLHELLIGRSAQ